MVWAFSGAVWGAGRANPPWGGGDRWAWEADRWAWEAGWLSGHTSAVWGAGRAPPLQGGQARELGFCYVFYVLRVSVHYALWPRRLVAAASAAFIAL